MQRPRVARAMALLLLVPVGSILPSGCGRPTPGGSVSSALATATPVAPGSNDVGVDLPRPAPPPVWDPLSNLAAVDAASQVMRTFARPALSGERWFRELSPLLSPAAADVYVGTDPAQVPARAVSGVAQLLPSTSGYIARVAVPTDAGAYTVVLSRKSQAGPWLAERITPPPGLGP